MGGAAPAAVPPLGVLPPQLPPAAPAGRGRRVPLVPAGAEAPPAGRGRGRGAAKAAGGSRPTMASLQALLVDGLGRLQQGQDQLAARLTAVESGAVLGTATPRPPTELAFQTP